MLDGVNRHTFSAEGGCQQSITELHILKGYGTGRKK